MPKKKEKEPIDLMMVKMEWNGSVTVDVQFPADITASEQAARTRILIRSLEATLPAEDDED